MKTPTLALATFLIAFIAGCSDPGQPVRAPADAGVGAPGLRYGAPDEVALDARPLIRLAEWVRDGSLPILSILVSRDGVLVFELYTSGLTREPAHYLMSVTKSFTSALVGAASDRRVIGPPETMVADALPAGVFASRAQQERFRAVSIRDVLGMSALDAQVPPHRNLPEDQRRQQQFLASPNRLKFALTQALLPQPGVSFQYTDITPYLATGILEYATGATELELAERYLFGPLEFRNYEWMHEDPSGIDNGAYGLRLRPVDMQKFGILYLNGGAWNGTQLLSREWAEQSFSPWIRNPARNAGLAAGLNYGWYFWTYDYGARWTARVANGWKGQRIAVIPEQRLVVTMTGIIEAQDGDEDGIFRQIIEEYLVPAVAGAPGVPARPDPALRGALADALLQVRNAPSRIAPGVEGRMVPSIAPKEQHHGFQPK